MILIGVLRRVFEVGCLTFVILISSASIAQVAVPTLTGHVIDQTGTLTLDQRTALDQALAAFEARKGTQVAVLMVPTTAPEAIEQYALRVAEHWKIGRKNLDDGVILVVAKNDRAVRIEVGYGLEGTLSDITSKRIISETILPRFKMGDFFGGLQLGADQIIAVVDGELLPLPKSDQGGTDHGLRQFAPLLLVVALGVGSLLRKAFGSLGGALLTGGAVAGLAWLIMGTMMYAILAGLVSLVFTLVGAGTVLHNIGGYGGGGRGALGGGGFRGNGGGFGGGGASGRW